MPKLTTWLEAAARDERLATRELIVSDAALARALGYGPSASRPMPPHVADTVARLRPLALDLIDGRAAWAAVPVKVFGDFVLCERPRGSRLAVGAIVARHLHLSEAVLVFVATIGNRLEAEARRMIARDDPLAGFILDALGSAAVDACADAALANASRQALDLGWNSTNRYSPGYCTWDTADQFSLFTLLPRAPAGVELTTSGLMQPLKSISGVVGIGRDVRFAEYDCAFCGLEDCRQRMAPLTV